MHSCMNDSGQETVIFDVRAAWGFKLGYTDTELIVWQLIGYCVLVQDCELFPPCITTHPYALKY